MGLKTIEDYRKEFGRDFRSLEEARAFVGSEEHYQDLIDRAGRSMVGDYYAEPKTLGEAVSNLRRAFRELLTALGLLKFLDWFARTIGKFLIKKKWRI